MRDRSLGLRDVVTASTAAVVVIRAVEEKVFQLEKIFFKQNIYISSFDSRTTSITATADDTNSRRSFYFYNDNEKILMLFPVHARV